MGEGGGAFKNFKGDFVILLVLFSKLMCSFLS